MLSLANDKAALLAISVKSLLESGINEFRILFNDFEQKPAILNFCETWLTESDSLGDYAINLLNPSREIEESSIQKTKTRKITTVQLLLIPQ